ncbi:MAG TPA: helix-turn-helix domain-containing protein [Geobacterales bacterium]|nr:helix-turn-helix domain-containing protein [Geobacterales bacterium]
MVTVPRLMPDEIISRAVYPMIRAMIAKRLIEKYNYNQKEVADILGITQAAVSYYLSDKRAVIKQFYVSNELEVKVNELADSFVRGKIDRDQLVIGIVKIVDYMTKTKALCSIHQVYEKDLRVNECNICFERYSLLGEDNIVNIIRKHGK